jgi:hypothetical protein
MSNRLVTALILGLLGLMIVVNRPFIVRQATRFHQVQRFHSPIHDAKSSHARRSFFLMESSDDAVPDLDAQRNGIGSKVDPKTHSEGLRLGILLKSGAIVRSPVHIFESVLNL